MAILPNIGEMRHRIRIDRRRDEANEVGDLVGVWRPLASGVAARLIVTKGGEEVRAARLSGISSFDITIRSTVSTRQITTADRIVDERSGQTFNVQWVGNLDGKDRFLTITAEAGGHTDG